MPASRTPLLGQELRQARDTWFFQWFHLKRQTARREGGGGLIRFAPQGGAFRNKVALDLAVAADGAISSMTLGLERGFVDDADDGPYARDIAQAFLRAALPPADAVQARALADEIASLDPPPEQAHGPSEAYAVFLGQVAEHTLESDYGALVTLANLGINGTDWLLISVSRKP
ncbi:MAG TPA: hypothetical protein VJU15_02465 [Gemmatimonadales bacterium]|nr:hypothetical protein [Gemmatimonadales bacterium]